MERLLEQTEDSPTLAYEHHWTPYFQNGIHQGGYQQVPVALQEQNLAVSTAHPASHGEGRFVASTEWIREAVWQTAR